MRLCAAGVLAAASLAAGGARANGAFPAAAQIVAQPGDPSHVVVRATFGILPSRDGGATFDFICEAAANYGMGQDPGIAVTGDGSIFAGVYGGLSATHGDACAWTLALGGAFLVDVTVDRAHPSTAYTIGSTSSGYFLWRSDDDARTWASVAALPANFYPATVDVAPSDSQRLYASGGFFVEGGSRSSLARSVDGGLHWTILPLPATPTEPIPYIAGIDPLDANTVWVRPFTEPGQLLVTRDGGDTFANVLTVPGDLQAFAIAPDGHAALAGGPMAGLYYADLTAVDAGAPITFNKRSDYKAGCLLWSDAAILACGDSKTDGTLLVASVDEGVTFAPKVPLACVRGPLDCPVSSSVGGQCPDVWQMTIATQIAHDTCADAGAPTSSSRTATGTGPASTGRASSSVSTTTGPTSAVSGGGGGAGGGASSAHAAGGSGCGCDAPGSAPKRASLAIALATMTVFVFIGRNRRRIGA